MATVPRSLGANLIRSDFGPFVRHAFKMDHGEKLGNQPYVDHLCYVISPLIEGEINRLLINLPPQHLKSFVGTICLAAYLLGKNPRLRIIIAAYNDTFAEALCGKIRNMMQSPWYQQAFTTRIRDGHPVTLCICLQLNQFGLAYLHVIEPRVKGSVVIVEGEAPIAAHQFRKIFKGKIVAAGGFEPDSAEAIIRSGDADLVSFGRYFVSTRICRCALSGPCRLVVTTVTRSIPSMPTDTPTTRRTKRRSARPDHNSDETGGEAAAHYSTSAT
jgi:hypothetical protein